MNFDEEEVLAYTRSAIISVTALELLLLLKGGRGGAVGDMVRELRVCPDTLGRITKFSKHEPN